MSCAQAHWVRLKPLLRVMQLKLHEPTMTMSCTHTAHVNDNDVTGAKMAATRKLVYAFKICIFQSLSNLI